MTQRHNDNVELEHAAEVLRVHPRTVLRAITGESNPKWFEGMKYDVPKLALAEAYGCSLDTLEKLVWDKDELVTPSEAMMLTGLSVNTVRRRFPQVVRRGHVVRYLKSAVTDPQA